MFKDKAKIIRRLKIIKGQIEGVTKMIDEEKDCPGIMIQLKAIKNAFSSLGEDFVGNYLLQCIKKDKKNISEKELKKALEVLAKY